MLMSEIQEMNITTTYLMQMFHHLAHNIVNRSNAAKPTHHKKG
jgi:hypothetical protein